jgi:phage repressor protein C with HTH and peptisase S24 domain
MYTHQQIWAAIDALADQRGWSVGRLAVKAGLDATALNPSKRVGIGAKPRWPSTETLCKLLSASDTSFSRFAEMVDSAGKDSSNRMTPRPRLPVMPVAKPRGLSRR